jgi:hypothetical protein
MRTAILSLLFALAALFASLSATATLHAESQFSLPPVLNKTSATIDDGWRHTVDGWEHNSAWQPAATASSTTSNRQATIDRVCAIVLILSGAAGAVVLLLVEIDPIEFNAFRVWTRR